MEIAGTQRIPAPRAAVWDALNDPEVLKRCLPGCESVERSAPDAFKVVVAAVVGPLRAKFNGQLRMTEALPPASCTMVFEGQGGVVGFGQGSAKIALRDEGAETELGYTAQAQVGGKLAQIGSRLIDSVAKKMSDDFFKAFVKQFGTADGSTAEAATQAGAARTAPAETNAAAHLPAAAPGAAVPRANSTTAESIQMAAPATVATLRALPAAESAVASHSAPATPAAAVLVPGWWLAVAALLGSATTLAGALLLR